jgi:hypothetical protein
MAKTSQARGIPPGCHAWINRKDSRRDDEMGASHGELQDEEAFLQRESGLSPVLACTPLSPAYPGSLASY